MGRRLMCEKADDKIEDGWVGFTDVRGDAIDIYAKTTDPAAYLESNLSEDEAAAIIAKIKPIIDLQESKATFIRSVGGLANRIG